MTSTFSFLNEYKNVSINTFDFSDVFSMNGTNMAKIESVTLPNGVNTYVVKVGSVFGSLNAGETFSVDPALAFPSEASVMWESIGFEGAYDVKADLTVNLTKWNGEAFLEVKPFLKTFHFDISYRDFSLNKKVKFREDFRPFAASILSEYADKFFECDSIGEHLYPFMLATVKVKPEVADKIPAVLHIDKTSRIQVVDKDINPPFWNLINEYFKLSGIPLILNTSFNTKGEPIVCTPNDAIQTFLNSNLDSVPNPE